MVVKNSLALACLNKVNNLIHMVDKGIVHGDNWSRIGTIKGV